MRPKGSAEGLEVRRRHAIDLVEEQGLTPAEAAEMVGVTVSAISQWRKLFRERGESGLAAKPVVRAGKLSPTQKQDLVQALAAGPQQAGLGQVLWNCPLVTRLIERKFGVSYHPDHVGRLLHALGYTPQMPKRIARQHDAAAVKKWRQVTWPRIKKGATSAS